MSLPQIVRAASAGWISWLQAAGYQAFKGKVLPLAMALLPTTRGSRRVSRDFGPWAPAPQAQTMAKLGQGSSGCGPRDPLASRRHIAGASVRLYRRAGLEKRNPPGGIRRSELEVHAAGDRIRGERATRVALQRDVVKARGSIISVHILAENFPIRPEMVGETATDRPAAAVKSRLFSNRKRIGVQAADRAEFLVMGDGRVGPSPAALDVRQEVSPGVAPIRPQCGQETPSHFCHSSARTGYVSGAPAFRIPSVMRSRWAT